ncbi:transcriptional regulator [Klebsiella pneumoniae]|uniref:Transcriptional regulator n=1 Tax=Klebsiella pneumoniae TaxID=573 RepID=A0A378F6Q9_KLEPN|nr:transcriptional regulator [Klebsiella pneumoniae]STR78557.1 transcriptional regulator [Klebsiella pneumoniae]STR92918.1 transcriptional regulator [Klebsiella pneumoniae]STW39634.1 transcriptional regulator [Klebsiella pneumoniae]VTM15744.1 transcriptional regulator [Klebsiella pneumoniae]
MRQSLIYGLEPWKASGCIRFAKSNRINFNQSSRYKEGSLAFDGEAMTLSQVLYSLWLGANLQAKITRSATPLESALAHAKQIIAAPAV